MNNTFKHWKRYLHLHNVGENVVLFQPDYFSISIVIPCFNEPDILITLQSIWKNETSNVKVAVIVVVNSGENALEEVKSQNKKTYSELLEFAHQHNNATLTLFPMFFEGIRKKHAGAGFARKLGMDYATWLFFSCQNNEGIIVSLDADCTVEKQFIRTVWETYIHKSTGIATHYFEHPFPNEKDARAIIEYELYLRYFKWALWYAGFPYAIHTVGSSFSVKADVYVKHGGMNRRQGGEDFYFLHKIVPHENFAVIKETTVYPSPRISNRVPFGTGPALQQIEESQKELWVYNLESFYQLRQLIQSIPQFYKADSNAIRRLVEMQPDAVKELLLNQHLEGWLNEVNANVSSKDAFVKRMFSHLNAFKIVQFLNETHQNYFAKQPISNEAAKLLNAMDKVEIPEGNHDLLMYFRKMDREDDGTANPLW